MTIDCDIEKKHLNCKIIIYHDFLLPSSRCNFKSYNARIINQRSPFSPYMRYLILACVQQLSIFYSLCQSHHVTASTYDPSDRPRERRRAITLEPSKHSLNHQIIHSLHVSTAFQHSLIHSTRQLSFCSSCSTQLFIPNSIHS